MAELRTVVSDRKFSTARAIGALVMREMSATYGRTPGGYIWAILEPAGGIALLTLVFSFAFSSPPIGTSFAMFYTTGVVPFIYYNDIAQKVSQSLNYSKPLLAYPSVTFFDALAGRLITNMISGLLVVYVIFFWLYIFFDTRTDPQLDSIGLSIAMATAFAFAVGTLNCYLFLAFPVWFKIWNILNRPLFIISCVLFVFDSVPKSIQGYLWYNPLVHVIGQMRHGFYPSYHADYVSPAYVFGVSLVGLVIGLALLLRYHRDLLNNM
ncbi:sugar ABC transporter permease [Paracoccus aurantiacus]|uniref:Sugar ABC transporter permease n=1 Tax=Paracoccus aurantiacus TaxID=2599412 RepID=A0A5C6RUA4_9RHOB|nr:ABC transporter permease [Paracoccus aurantiacus]TXB65687.1 sugar ABC transporter permease [Paracoccus aurantiacus]